MKVNVNGKAYTVDAAADMPLLWVLRDLIGLTGTKYGCGEALCGSCVVHLDGEAVRSCVTPMSRVGEKKVTTIEGLDHPLQKAWVEQAVPQCGYCQTGQLMCAAALLAANPKPTDADIDASMAGSICRCGTYNRIRDAIKAVAK